MCIVYFNSCSPVLLDPRTILEDDHQSSNENVLVILVLKFAATAESPTR